MRDNYDRIILPTSNYLSEIVVKIWKMRRRIQAYNKVKPFSRIRDLFTCSTFLGCVHIFGSFSITRKIHQAPCDHHSIFVYQKSFQFDVKIYTPNLDTVSIFPLPRPNLVAHKFMEINH